MSAQKKSWPKRLIRWLFPRLVLMSFSLAILFVVAEIVLSIMGYGKLVIYEWHDDLYWIPKENQKCVTKIGNKPVQINSHRLRGVEVTQEKPESYLRILCIGDSRTFGWGLTEEECHAGLLQARLSEHTEELGVSGVEVLNAGVNAWSFPQLEVYYNEIGRSFQPDIVVVGGANYWNQFTADRSEEFKKSFRRRVFLKNLLRRSAVLPLRVRDSVGAGLQPCKGEGHAAADT